MRVSIPLIIIIALLLSSGLLHAQNEYPLVSLHDLQEIPESVLIELEEMVEEGASVSAVQHMRHAPMLGDTVRVRGVITVDAWDDDEETPWILNRGRPSTAVYIQDPDDPEWGGVQIRDDSRGDSEDEMDGGDQTGLHLVQEGWLIEATVVVDIYPDPGETASLSSETQLSILDGTFIEVIDDTGDPLPYVDHMTIGDFMKGSGGGSTARNAAMKFPTGEPYLGAKVRFEGVRVNRREARDDGRWNWSVIDDMGNEMHIMDASKYNRGGEEADDPDWEPPLPNALLNIQGVMGAFPGYALIPIVHDDIEVLGVPPLISGITRSHITPPTTEGMEITALVEHPDPQEDVENVYIHYSVNGGEYQTVEMTDIGGEQYQGTIPAQSEGDLVLYYLEAEGGGDASTVPAVGELQPFFYHVRDGGTTIFDVKFSPYFPAVYPALDGETVTVSGVVTATTDDISGYVHIQDGNDEWSGIWIYGPGVANSTFERGDEVQVTGDVEIDNVFSRVPRIFVPSEDNFEVLDQGLDVPEPLVFTAADFPAGRGADHPDSEPYMGMLLRFENLTITENLGFGDFLVEDGSGEQLYIADTHGPAWTSTYSVNPNDEPENLLLEGSTIDGLIGILFYSFNNYKIIPRQADDFMGVTSVTDMIEGETPGTFKLTQNYPNPFNPATQIQFSLPEEAHVTLKVFNVLGQRVKILVDEHHTAGTYTATFDAGMLPSGVYFYRIEAGDFVETKRMMLLK